MSHVNVDEVELAKFSQLAHHWWDKNSEFKPLHDINPLRLEFIRQYSGDLTHKRVLDVGCGGGILSEALAQAGAKVMGIDLADKSLKVAKLHLLESGLKVDYQKIAVETLAAEQPAQFDVVTCMEMLEHVPDPHQTIMACAQLVKPGGKVFFSTLNRNPKAYFMAIIGAEYVLNLLPRGTHEYARFIRPAELARMARHAQMDVLTMTGLHYNLLRQSYRLGAGLDVNYLVACERIA